MKAHLRRTATRREGGQHGQTLAEFAIVLFLLAMIIMGIVDFSRAVYARSVVANAAREGARYAVIHPEDTQGIEDAARALVRLDNMKSFAVSVASHPVTATVEVQVTYTFMPVSVLIATYASDGPKLGLPMRARSVMRVEE